MSTNKHFGHLHIVDTFLFSHLSTFLTHAAVVNTTGKMTGNEKKNKEETKTKDPTKLMAIFTASVFHFGHILLPRPPHSHSFGFLHHMFLLNFLLC